jgi:hypothetical protein
MAWSPDDVRLLIHDVSRRLKGPRSNRLIPRKPADATTLAGGELLSDELYLPYPAGAQGNA